MLCIRRVSKILSVEMKVLHSTTAGKNILLQKKILPLARVIPEKVSEHIFNRRGNVSQRCSIQNYVDVEMCRTTVHVSFDFTYLW